MNIPLNAKVECTDGVCGNSSSIIVNPVTGTVTHLVVKEQSIPHDEYLVPIDQVGETSSDGIVLKCDRDQVKRMERFVETEFVKTDQYMPYYGEDTVMTWPYVIPESMAVKIEHERIPPGELAVRRGTYVQATDGPVGQVDELLIDLDTGHVTHLVLRQGHLWGQKVLTLPISAIDRADGQNVYLKLDKQKIGELPTIPVRLHATATDIELIVVTFDQADRADDALKTLKQFAKREAVAVINAAVLTKEQDGKTSLKETEDVGPRQGAVFGAITGGLIGLLGGPVGAVVGAAAGAATGHAAAKRIDLGLPDEYLKKLQNQLQAGSSALVVLVKSEWADQVGEALTDVGGQQFREMLSEEIVAQIASQDRS